MSALYEPFRKRYLEGTVTGDVTLDQPVELGWGRSVDAITWLPAEWVGDPGLTRDVRTATEVDLSLLPRRVLLMLYFRVTDSPEIEGGHIGSFAVDG